MAVKTVQAVINGQTYNLTLNSQNGKYEATVTAPAKSSYNHNEGHYYPITVKVADDAGNITTKDDQDAELGTSLKLKVKEKTPPAVTITSPTEGALLIDSTPEFRFKVTDTDSGVDAGSIKIIIDSNPAITVVTKNPVSGGYECSYTPSEALSDGSHTVKIQATDNDGNAVTSTPITFKVDTVAPTLSVTAPVDKFVTNSASCTVIGKTVDATSGPVTVTVKLNSGQAESVEVGSSGDFSKVLTLTEGSNTITIVARDKAGKTTEVVRTVTLNTKAPVIKAVTITPNPVDAGKTYIISVDVTDV